MMRVTTPIAVALLLCLLPGYCKAQKKDLPKKLYFNLYTDSIKTQLYFYVNVEGVYRDERILPMDTSIVAFQADQGTMSGNEWIPPKKIDFEFVRFKVWLRCNPEVNDSIQVWMKRGIDPRDNMDLPEEPVEIRKRKR